MRETWYLLEDGSVADPREVSPDAAGKLRHKNGVYVAMRGDAYSSRGVDPEAERATAKSKAKADPQPKNKEEKPEAQRGGYRTRESRAG
jgi:hypothetical protein